MVGLQLKKIPLSCFIIALKHTESCGAFGVLPPQQPCSTDRTNRFLKNCTCRVEASSFEFFRRVAFRNGAFQFEIEIYIVNRSDEA